jgi:phosphate starvation-inducible PhoH-like protein
VAKRKASGQSIFSKLKLQLKEITPLTPNQSTLFDKYANGNNIFLHGCPGTGKSFLSIYLAVKEMLPSASPYKKILIVRSAVPSREVGFLPGTAEEKAAIYEPPYAAIFAELFGRSDAYDVLKEVGAVEFVTTSFLRGNTFQNCLVIVDEFQNMKFEELNTIITRIGTNAKILFCGDFYQNDLTMKRTDTSGFSKFKAILEQVPQFAFIRMGAEDIVRGPLVKAYIMARIKYEEVNGDTL